MDRFLQKFLNYLTLQKNYSEHTIEAYESDLKQFFGFMRDKSGDENAGADSFTRAIIGEYLYILSNTGLARKSIARKLASIKSFGKFLTKESIIEKNPAAEIKTPKVDRKEPVFLSTKEIELSMNVPDGDDILSYRNHAILELFYSTGIRLSELQGLDLDYVDFYNDVIRVLGKRNR